MDRIPYKLSRHARVFHGPNFFPILRPPRWHPGTRSGHTHVKQLFLCFGSRFRTLFSQTAVSKSPVSVIRTSVSALANESTFCLPIPAFYNKARWRCNSLSELLKITKSTSYSWISFASPSVLNDFQYRSPHLKFSPLRSFCYLVLPSQA